MAKNPLFGENRLVQEGVRSFVDSFDRLIGELRKKRDAVGPHHLEQSA